MNLGKETRFPSIEVVLPPQIILYALTKYSVIEL